MAFILGEKVMQEFLDFKALCKSIHETQMVDCKHSEGTNEDAEIIDNLLSLKNIDDLVKMDNCLSDISNATTIQRNWLKSKPMLQESPN